MEFSERAEILLFTTENVALKLNRLLRLSNISLSKIPPGRDFPLTGNWPLHRTLIEQYVKANFQSVEFSERTEILLFTTENVALKLNRLLRLSNISLSKIPPGRDFPLTGNWPLHRTPTEQYVKANFQSVEFSERAEILLFTTENVALKLNRLLRLSNISLSKIPPARDIPLTGNWPLHRTPTEQYVKANFQSVEFSERAEILLFTRENVALKLNRLLRMSNISLSKIPPARDIPLTGNWP